MPLSLLNSPFVASPLSPLTGPVLATSASEVDAFPESGEPFTVSFGDGRIDIQFLEAPALAGFTVTSGDGAVTIIPAEEA
jgi:hypothetical protein